MSEINSAIQPILAKNELVRNLRDEFKDAFFRHIADKATAEFFSKHHEYQKYQKKIDEEKEREDMDKKALDTFRKMRGIGISEFEKIVLAKLDKIVQERDDEKKWKMDEFSSGIFNVLLQYFTPTSNSNLSRKKGIFLMGSVGVGKTTLFKGFQENPLHSFRIVTAQNLVEMYIESADMLFEFLKGRDVYETDSFGYSDRNIVVDEVGREELSVTPKGTSWKTEPVNVMEKVFFWLYDHPEIRIHMISNAGEEGLHKLYGEACFSRINEEFNLVRINNNAPDRRFEL